MEIRELKNCRSLYFNYLHNRLILTRNTKGFLYLEFEGDEEKFYLNESLARKIYGLRIH